MKVTHDKFELPVAVADSAEELAEILHVKSPRSIRMRCKKSLYDFRLVIISINAREEMKNGH